VWILVSFCVICSEFLRSNTYFEDVPPILFLYVLQLTLLVQYSHYKGKLAPTPHLTDPPMTTIGGEPNGRAPVVIEDPNPNGNGNANDKSTMVLGGMPEPGRDIFGGVSVHEVTTGGGGGGERVEKEQKEQKEQKVVSEVGHSTTTTTTEAGVSSPPAAADTDAQAPQGPLGEAEAIADQVAKELYPDAP
jgi:dolichyl-phosphate-mannose-protein mannosyltransferase